MHVAFLRRILCVIESMNIDSSTTANHQFTANSEIANCGTTTQKPRDAAHVIIINVDLNCSQK